ncbi:MAG: c-type cytochrome [Opitutales bacterium]|nr:c-type cytochrome [Opitutales bacterium]
MKYLYPSLLIASLITSIAFSATPKKSVMAWPPAGKTNHVAVDKFSTSPDLEVTLWAKSPQFYNPTNMSIDPLGRIWITEGVNYREKLGIRRNAGDRIMVLIDSDNDGTADQSKVFLQDPYLESPLGISVFDNQIIISQPPDIVIYTDVNRDLKFDPKIDKKEILLTGFNGRQHDHSLHSVTSGPDGKWYFNSGNCGAIFTDNSGKTFRMNSNYRGGASEKYFYTPTHELKGAKSDDGYVWSSGFSIRMNSDGTDAEVIGHGYRNSYEQVVNSLGDMYQSDNDDYSSCRNSYVLEFGSAGYYSLDGQHKWQADKRPGQAIPRAHWRQDDPGTFDAGDVYGSGGPTGVTFYENGALGDDWVGTYLSGEASRNTVFGYKPEPQGATYSMDRFNFLTTRSLSSDISEEERDERVHFRPSDISIGPDGAVYVADWYDPGSGGHATRDESSSGAIYRVAPKGFQSHTPKLNLSTISGQVDALLSPNPNVRFLGFKELQKMGAKAYPKVSQLLSHKNPYLAARAIWLLPYLGDDGMKRVNKLLESNDSLSRLVAYRSVRRSGGKLVPQARKMAKDSSPGIRRDVALSMRPYTAKQANPVLAEVAKRYDGTDKNYVESIGLGAAGKEAEVWKYLRNKLGMQNPAKWDKSFARITWRLGTSEALHDLKSRAKNETLPIKDRLFAIESIAFVNHPLAPDALFELGKNSNEPKIKQTITQWILRRSLTAWNQFELTGKLKSSGIFDPEKIQLIPISTPEPTQKTKLDVNAIALLKGDAVQGKTTIMRCTMCHEVNGIGANYGPRLEGWAAKQSTTAIIHAIVNPSQGIAHGFQGTEYILKDGGVIHGITESRGDPAIVLTQGGLTQMIPQSKVKSSKRMKRSLMLSAEQLALSPQDVADIVAFMKGWE